MLTTVSRMKLLLLIQLQENMRQQYGKPLVAVFNEMYLTSIQYQFNQNS